jgi:hypothetical protein
MDPFSADWPVVKEDGCNALKSIIAVGSLIVNLT